VLNKFVGSDTEPDLSKWETIVAAQQRTPEQAVRIGMVAKYVDNEDTYISVLEALKAAAWQQGVGLETVWISAEDASEQDFASVDALLVPGGFGSRGIEGKIAAARYALDHNVPYLGLCLGLQVAVIASARKAGLDDANSTEFNTETPNDVVYIMEGQEGQQSTGGTLRLGDYTATLVEGSKVAQAYGATETVERHRHRYEVNQKFMEHIERGGLKVTGSSPDGRLVEYIEATDNPYFVATQAHPEFKSRPDCAHPLFVGFIKAARQ
jgi:CTP synthase